MDAFSKGYEKFGFNKTASGDIVYREWAPAAQGAALIGDFNGWNPEQHAMTKAGLYRFNAVDPERLKAPGFNPWSL
jgi:1,4-alpha-glucan branching enzyme